MMERRPPRRSRAFPTRPDALDERPPSLAGLGLTQLEHVRIWRELRGAPRRYPDALDVPRGPMPDDEPWHPPDVMLARRARKALAGMTETERAAATAPTHVEAAERIGRSRERARQIRRDVAHRACNRLTASERPGPVGSPAWWAWCDSRSELYDVLADLLPDILVWLGES